MPRHEGGDGEGPHGTGAAEARRTRQIVLLLAGIVLATVLALAALFFLGMRLSLVGAGGTGGAVGAATAPAGSAAPALPTTAAPTPTTAPHPTPALTARPDPGAPLPPGTYAWDELGGGECLDPYAGPWAEEVTVVDCGLPHPAQLVARAPYPTAGDGTSAGVAPDGGAYPGAEAIAARIGLLCGAPTVIGAAAGAYPDLQLDGAYPATAEQWDVGQRDYFCFVSRASGEPLTGSVAAGS